jgi:hypothetical protein
MRRSTGLDLIAILLAGVLGCGGGADGGGAPPTGMVSVPAGPFTMGCNEAGVTLCRSDERPAHEVNVPAFRIDATEG